MARAYGLLRDIIERKGGTMEYVRSGYPFGAWELWLDGKSATIIASGNTSFPELDRLYVPKTPHPKKWTDYENRLIPGAEERLLALLR